MFTPKKTEAPGQVPAKNPPRLCDLGGMKEARAWGDDLARDLAEFKAGKLDWRDVDPGVVLHGPPGTGKTLFAKALAATCNVPLIATSYAEWQRTGDGCLGDVLLGMKMAFDRAACTPPCILFIDELDSLPARGRSHRHDDWWRSLVNAMLELLNGAADRAGVVVVAACNDIGIVDPALLRSGRLDRRIAIGMPSVDELNDVLRFHLTKEEVRKAGDLQAIAVHCIGMTPADVSKLVRDARRHARKWKRDMRRVDLLAVLEPDKRDADLDWRIAVHEAGHAVAAISLGLMSEANVSIVGQTGIGGRTFLAFENTVMTAKTVSSMMTTLLAGRAAEQIVLGSVSSGSGGGEDSDLARATRMATNAVSMLGLSQRPTLMWYGPQDSRTALVPDNPITAEVDAMLTTSYDAALALLTAKRAKLEGVARALVSQRVLSHRDLVKQMECI